jgi:glucose-6-phosphate 1-dehydrogenase
VQVLALLTMERPVSMHPDDVRDEKTKLIRSIQTLDVENVVLGQYTAGNDQPGYTEDDDVPDDSQTATYAALRLAVDNERWEGVPIVILAGKALSENLIEARVQLKTQPGFFGENANGMRNEFVLEMKPEGRMYMKMVIKKPGLEMEMATESLDMTFKCRCASPCLTCTAPPSAVHPLSHATHPLAEREVGREGGGGIRAGCVFLQQTFAACASGCMCALAEQWHGAVQV